MTDDQIPEVSSMPAPTGLGSSRSTKRFIAQYFHDGGWWAVDIYAYNWQDAETRCRRLNLQLNGEHVMTIPAGPGVGWIMNLICAVRNFFWKPKN